MILIGGSRVFDGLTQDPTETRNANIRSSTMSKIDTDQGKFKANKRPYMKLFTSDYRDGTARMSFELQGFYFRILTYLHDGETVPSDPVALATFLQCSPRTVRCHLSKLIALGKLYEASGELRNKRVDRDLGPSSDPTRAELEPNSSRTQLELEPNSARTFQNIEQNQGPEICTIERTTSTTTSISRGSEERNTVSPVQEPASPDPPGPADCGELKTAFNGSTESMLADVQAWMGPTAKREQAVRWLKGTVAAYGASRVAQAWTIVVAKQAANELVANPLPLWAKTAGGLREAPKPSAAKPDPKTHTFVPNRFGPGRWVLKTDEVRA